MRSLVVLPSLNGVALGQTATLTLAVGPVIYHKLVLQYGNTAGNPTQATTEAAIAEIRLKLNGKIQRRFSAAKLDSINAFSGKAMQGNGYLEIFFSEPWRRTPQAEDALAWGTQNGGGVSTFQVEVDFAAGGAAGPTMVAHAEVEYLNRPIGVISKWRQYTQPVAAIGKVTNNTLPKTDGYQALHCFPVGANDISDITVTVDQVIRMQGTLSDLTNLLKAYGWTPQAGMFHAVFDRTGRVSDYLPMVYTHGGKQTGVVGNFQLDFDMAVANSFPLIAEVLGQPD